MKRINEEMSLLQRLAEGLLDGVVGNYITTSGGSTIWKVIENGTPRSYKQGPSGRFFNGKENEACIGKLRTLQEWNTDEDKLDFLRRFGWLLRDEDARSYSAKFKRK